MKKKLLFLLTVLLIGLQSVWAQTNTIRGKITDEKGEPIVGATIRVKGTNKGTASDMGGNFKLITDEGAILSISAIGMKVTEKAAQNGMSVKMATDSKNLSDVVVTAVGIKREKRSLGYAIQQVKGDDLTRNGNNDVMNGLAGKAAGVTVINSAGDPGAGTFIQLRGATSIAGDNSPLIVIDGIPINNSVFGTSLGDVAQTNRLMDLNPNDIESISVLKGQAATALYGIYAGKGAIVITTKKGKKGKLNIDYSTNYSIEKVNKLPGLQNKFAQGVDGLSKSPTSGSSMSWGPSFDTLYWSGTPFVAFNSDGDSIGIFDNNGKIIGATAAAGVSTATKATPYDNVGKFFQNGKTWGNNVSVSGGNDKTTFRTSLGYLNQSGIIPNSSFQKINIGTNLQTQIKDNLRFATNVNYSNSGGSRIQTGSNTSGIMLGLLRSAPSFDNSNGTNDPKDKTAYMFSDGTMRAYRGNITESTVGRYDNPYWTVNENPYHDKVDRVIASAEAEYKPMSWLSILYRLGSDMYSDRRHQGFNIISRAHPAGQVNDDQYFYRSMNSDLILTATKSLTKDMNGSLMVGNNMYGTYLSNLYSSGTDLVVPNFYNQSNALTYQPSEFKTRYRSYAFYADGKVDYKNYLFLNVTGRVERLSTLNKAFFFPSASLSYVFTDHIGMKNNKVLPYGKLRVSYAGVGNGPTFTNYPFATYYGQAAAVDGWTTGFSYPYAGTVGSFLNSSTQGNPNLKPERIKTFEIGTELRFAESRITLDVNYYHSVSKDQILPTSIPASSGYTAAILNAGSMRNKGLEISVIGNVIKTKHFNWDLTCNWSMNRNKVLSLYSGVDNFTLNGFDGSVTSRAVVGQPFGALYGRQWLRDANGRVVLEGNTSSPNYGMPITDVKSGVIGNFQPKWIAGLGTSFNIYGVTLNLLFDIRHGGQMWNGSKGILNYFGTGYETANRDDTSNKYMNDIYKNAVLGHLESNGSVTTYDTASAHVPVKFDQYYYQNIRGGFDAVDEQFIEDASFVRLREFSIGYSLPSKIIKKTPFTSLSLAFIGRNLWLHTKYTGLDPNTSLAGATSAQGLEYFNSPGTKSYGVNLKVGF